MHELLKKIKIHFKKIDLITTNQNIKGKILKTESITEGNITIHYISNPYSNEMSVIRKIIAYMFFVIGGTMLILKIKPKLIFATSTPLTVGIIAIISKCLYKTKYVFEIRDLWPLVPIACGAIKNRIIIKIAEKLEYYSFRYSESIIVVAPTMKKHVKKVLGCVNKEIYIATHSALTYTDKNVFLGEVEKRIKKKKEKIILYCGTLGGVNNVGMLSALAHEIFNEGVNYKLIVVGSGKNKNNLIKYAKENNLINNTIEFYDEVPRKEISIFYKEADIALCLFDNIPELFTHAAQNKFFDSLAYGVPTASNFKGWQSRIASKTGTGIIISNDSKVALEQLKLFLENKNDINIKINCNKLIKRFSFDESSKTIIKALKNIK